MIKTTTKPGRHTLTFYTALFSCIILFFCSTLAASASSITASSAQGAPDMLNHNVKTLKEGKTLNLAQAYSGKVLLVVNTASQCGFTSQYKSLETLYQKYKEKGLVVLGFPSNDFFQERSSDETIAEFCQLQYGVTFPLFQKSSIRGKKANPFYKALNENHGKAPRWNFYKYLIDRNGKIISLFPSTTKPDSLKISTAIERLL